jgi:acyl transferase domain-containing protein
LDGTTTTGAGPEELASTWVAGDAVDWGDLDRSTRPYSITLPTYPFARERHWVTDTRPPSPPTLSRSSALHPLVAYNCSTLSEVSFSSSLADTEFYAVDHVVNGLRMFPAAGFVEIACVAGTLASERRVRRVKDVVWVRPLILDSGTRTLHTVLKALGDRAQFMISSIGDDGETICHSEGQLLMASDRSHVGGADERMNIQTLKASGARRADGATYYRAFSSLGLVYGPAFQTIQETYAGETYVLSKLTLANRLKHDFTRYLLHPSMLDGALQTVAGLIADRNLSTPYVPFALDEIEIVHPVTQTCYAYAERVRSERQQDVGVMQFNIRLLNESGDVLVRLTNLYMRPLGIVPTTASIAQALTNGQLLGVAGTTFA